MTAARNILISKGAAKVSDFGLSRVTSSEDTAASTVSNVGPLKVYFIVKNRR